MASPARRPNAYTAPEGRRTTNADIYSLTATLFFLATGHDPPTHTGDDFFVSIRTGLEQHAELLLRDFPELCFLLARGMALNPARRFRNCEDMLNACDLFDPRARPTIASVKDTLSSIAGTFEHIREHSPIMLIRANSLLRQTRAVIEDRYDVEDITGHSDDIDLVLGEFMATAESDDLYLTPSQIKFWSKKNISCHGMFLAMNGDAARRGVTVRRVFVLSETEAGDQETHRVLRAHARLVGSLASYDINTKTKKLSARGFYCGVKVLTDAERAEWFEKNQRVGMWIRQDGGLQMLPLYDAATDTMVAMRCRSLDSTRRGIATDFERLYLGDDAQEIEDFLEDRRVL